LSVPPDSIAAIRGPTSKGRGREGGERRGGEKEGRGGVLPYHFPTCGYATGLGAPHCPLPR